MKSQTIFFALLIFVSVISLKTSSSAQLLHDEMTGKMTTGGKSSNSKSSNDQQRNGANRQSESRNSSRSGFPERFGGGGSDYVQDKLARERAASEARERQRIQTMGDFRRADREQTEKYLREQQQTRPRQQADFQRQWELGEQLRRENERNSPLYHLGRPENRYSVVPEPSTRGTAPRNYWNGVFERNGPTGNAEWDRRSNPIIDGRVYSVRERYGNHGVFGYFSPPSPLGHAYDLYESLGKRNLSAEQVMAMILEDLNRVFPGRAIGNNGQRVTVGNTFTLSVFGHLSRVEVVEVTPTSFTLKAIAGEHHLQGKVTHQIIKDSSGELWIRHTGEGVANEPIGLQVANYAAATYLWNVMGYNSNGMLNALPR